MTVVITGASGHIGGNLVRALLAQNRRCRVLVHTDTRAIDGLDVERVHGNLLEPDSLVAAFDGAEQVFHLAAQISISGDLGGRVQAINVQGTRNVVRACKDRGVKRLVHFSSVHAFSQQPLDQPLNEERALALAPGHYAYDRSKAMGIQEVLAGVEQGLDVVIVNPTGVIGPLDFKPSRMGQVVQDLVHRRLLGLVVGGFNWVDARDVVAGALAAEQKGRTGQMYLLGGHWLSVKDVAATVEKYSSVRAPRMVTPVGVARAVAPFAEAYAKITGSRPLFTGESLGALRANRNVSYDKAARELSYAPRPFEETIADTLDWFAQHKKEPAT